MARKNGSHELQHNMLNFFGDRDYDSFDHAEFELLKEKIGYALYGPPPSTDGYNDKLKEKINSLFTVIVRESNLVSKWRDRIVISFIYNCTEPLPKEKAKRAKKYKDYDPNYDLNPIPIFVLRKCKNSDSPCRIFIDDMGRVYSCWNEYITENKLAECNMVLPKNGQYMSNSEGNVLLQTYKSPACDLSTKILQTTDVVGAVGGIASGGVFVAAAIPAITVAPALLIAAGIGGAGVGAYSIGRSIYSLFDRGKHKETLSFANSEARGAYLNIVAGSLGFVGAGASMAVSKLAAEGVHIGNGARAAFNAINIANLSAGGISVANSGYDVIDQWINEQRRPSALTILQLSSSILFFGHAVYNFKTAGTVIKESQANALQEFQESLRSNRHRRMFNKLLKETIRQNDGNVQKGQAQVIKTINNINNKDQVFATLTKWNKSMNKNNVKFAVSDGEITLNGVVVDMTQFANMERNEALTFLTKLPNTPKPSQANVKTVMSMIDKSFEKIQFTDIKSLAMGVLKILGSGNVTITEKIINIVGMMIKRLLGDPVGYMKVLDEIFPNHSKYFHLFKMVTTFFQILVNEAEDMYQKWVATKDPSYERPYFLQLSLDYAKRATQIFEKVTELYFIATNPTEYGLEKLLTYFKGWFVLQVYNYEERQDRRRERMEHSNNTPGYKIDCPKCNGYFYKPR